MGKQLTFSNVVVLTLTNPSPEENWKKSVHFFKVISENRIIYFRSHSIPVVAVRVSACDPVPTTLYLRFSFSVDSDYISATQRRVGSNGEGEAGMNGTETRP
ncbi:hypothetical protein TNCV_2582401 [Trichonephila clavipes]|nr:hypothetical protein TNCV_2582401 [Trichonephila clavipes]